MKSLVVSVSTKLFGTQTRFDLIEQRNRVVRVETFEEVLVTSEILDQRSLSNITRDI